MKNKKPIIAIMYDFDNTLCTKDMQEYTFIPSLGESPEEFWNETKRIAESEGMDQVLTYMYLMLRQSQDHNNPITRELLKKCGIGIKLYPGVKGWFERINQYGEEHGVQIEHYIISSGLKEIIEGSSICDRFKKIYACEFHYDQNGIADWPKVAVNYTNKTQFLFRINKGIFNIGDERSVNIYVPEDQRRVPFRNMIYIGDGMTDVPCMKLVNVYGGQSIAVYHKKMDTVRQLLAENRANFIAPANYNEGKELDRLVKDIIIKMASIDKLVKKSLQQHNI